MESIKYLLEMRKDELYQYRQIVIERLGKLKYKGKPVCHIRISSRKKQVYLVQPEGDKKEIFITPKKYAYAQQVATYEYLIKEIKLIDHELNHINRFLSFGGTQAAEDYYGSLCKGRQNLIIPIKQTDEQFVEAWLSEPYEPRGIPFDKTEYYTDRNERVRSKSEILIANALNKFNVPYKYECPIYTRELGVIHPDFTALNVKRRKQIYWEHLGKMDDEEYARDNTYRINVYEKNGIFAGENLIVTWETSTMPLDIKLMEDKIRHFLIE